MIYLSCFNEYIMLMKTIFSRSIATFLLMALSVGLMAQTQTAAIGTKVKQTKVCDPSNNPVELPYFGQKNLMIFYVDPDHANQNSEFVAELEENQVKSDKIYGFGIVNLKDAPLLPNSIVRMMVRKKVKKTGAAIYTDPDHMLRDAWGLGDVNDQFVLLLIAKDGTIEFMSKGELSKSQIEEFYRVVDKLKK